LRTPLYFYYRYYFSNSLSYLKEAAATAAAAAAAAAAVEGVEVITDPGLDGYFGITALTETEYVGIFVSSRL